MQLLAIEKVHDLHAHQIFGQERVEGRELAARVAVRELELAAEIDRDHDQDRKHRKRNQAQPQIESKEPDAGPEHHERVAHHRDEARREHLAQRRDIVGHAREQPSRRVLVVDRDRKPLHVRVEIAAQLLSQALPEHLEQIALRDHGRDANEDQEKIRDDDFFKKVPMLGDDRVVDGEAEKPGLRERRGRSENDHRQSARERPPMAEDPPHDRAQGPPVHAPGFALLDVEVGVERVLLVGARGGGRAHVASPSSAWSRPST